MIHQSSLQTGPGDRQIFPKEFEEFSYLCYYTDTSTCPGGLSPWHWHDAFEITYMAQGSEEVRTPEKTIVLRQGDTLFINNGVPHAYQSMEPKNCVHYAQLFDMRFISGMYNGILERKYILPIRESGMQAYAFSANTPRRIRMASAVLQALELSREEPFGYEFDLRGALSEFWKGLIRETEELRAGSGRHSAADMDRIKQMMEFIRENYADHLALDAIAEAANISTRECARCFNRCLGMTPIQYVTQFRLQVAADALLHTGDSILEISERCGFSSPSYFSQIFADCIGCSPREYRTSGGVVTPRAD